MSFGVIRSPVLRDFSEGGSSQQQVTGNNSLQHVAGTGGTTTSPVNAQQLMDALGVSGAMYGLTGGSGSAIAQQGLDLASMGANRAYGLAGTGANQAAQTLGGQYLNSNPANAYLAPTAGGQFLSAGNPYFAGMVTQLGQAIQPQIAGQFEAAGRYGSGANANAFASALANQAGQLAYQNYGQERQNQLGAANTIGSLYGAERGNQLAALGQVGALGQAQTAPGMTAVQAGYTPLQQYLAALQGIQPGQTSSTTKDITQTSVGTGTSSGSGDQSSKGLNLF